MGDLVIIGFLVVLLLASFSSSRQPSGQTIIVEIPDRSEPRTGLALFFLLATLLLVFLAK